MLHEHKILIRYYAELMAALCLYGLVLVLSQYIGARMPHGALQTLVFFSPMLPFLLQIVAILRFFRRADEYWRRRMLEDFSITAAITGVWTFAYGFLENSGFPHLNLLVVWPSMGVICALIFIVRRLAQR
jgi:hypothetical protein